MSEALFRTLPRFDHESSPADQAAATNWHRPLSEDAPSQEDIVAEPEPVLAEELAIPAEQIDLTLLEQSLSTLAAQLIRIEQKAQAHVSETVQALAAKLFPALSERFLADELSAHLVTLVPASAAVIEIRAETGLAEQVRARIDEMPALMHRCTVTPVQLAGSARVDVSWQSGGLTFDFDGLLAACLAQLNSSSPISRNA